MSTIAVGLALTPACTVGAAEAQETPIDIGSRLELFVDDALVEAMTGGARLELQRPVRREIVFRTDAPWEGNASGYQSVFKDGDLYRMYYRGGHYRHSGEPAQALPDHPWNLCYAESDDGIHWRRPELGLNEFDGSTANNIIVDHALIGAVQGCPAHTATFMDANPDCPPEQKYKIITVGSKPRGLFVLTSADGVRFSLLSDQPSVRTGAFDSQNLMFWDPVRQEYREYHRGFRGAVRDIMTAASKDILNFPEPHWLQYPGSPEMALYTNQIQPYYRAPHIFMGFPMRYNDRGWSEPMLDLPGLDERLARAKSHRRYGTTVTDAVFMSSRDGLSFRRWGEAFIRPGSRRKDSWVYGDNFVFWGMVETKSHLGDAPDELSLYAVDGYWEGTCTDFRRYTLRLDGFVSAHAPFSGGEVVTKPLVFDGGNLALNVETSAAGGIQVEIQDVDGTPVQGYSLADCPPIPGDHLRHVVRWSQGGDVRPLSGKPVRLRFVLSDADLYSFQFVPHVSEPERPDLSACGGYPRRSVDRGPFIVLDDDFQSVEAGTSPTEADLNPLVGDGDRGWLISEGSKDRVQVLNDDPVGSGTAGARHYLKAERRAEKMREGGQAWVRFSPQDAVDSENGLLELDARILMPAANAYCVDIDGYDNPPREFGRRGFQVRFFPDGRVTYYDGEEHVTVPDVVLPPDTWQDVSIRARLAAAEFDLTVAGATATGLPFANDTVHRIEAIALCPNTSNCTLYIDSVKVRVVPRP